MNHFYVEMTKIAGVDDGRGAGAALTAGGVAAGLGAGHVVLGHTRLLPSALLGDFNAHVAANGEHGMIERWSNRKFREALVDYPAKELRNNVYRTLSNPIALLESPGVGLPARVVKTTGVVLAGSALAGGIVAHAIGSHFARGE